MNSEQILNKIKQKQEEIRELEYQYRLEIEKEHGNLHYYSESGTWG